MPVVWTSDLATGVGWQDKEHKELFKVLDRLAVVSAGGGGSEAVESAVSSVDDYVVGHFHHEETAMSKYDYPDILDHLVAHTSFIEEFSSIKNEYLLREGLEGARLEELVLDRVVGWWHDHIMTIDKPLGRFLARRTGEKGP